MRETRVRFWQSFGKLMAITAAVCFLFILSGSFALQVQAEETGKITVSAAKVRQEASTGSTQVGSLERGDTFTITGETKGADGKTWYQVICGDGTKGYVRSDLAEKQGENANDTVTAQVTRLNPVSASVTGKQVNVRKNCNTDSSVVASVPQGTALTIIGQATGTDSKVWYQVSFISDNAEVTGFVRSDLVQASGEITPYVEPATDPSTDNPGPTEQTPPPVEETKDWETSQADDGSWMLTENATGKSYPVKDLIDISKENATKLTEVTASVKSQKIAIIILVIVLVLLVAVIGLLVFMFREELLDMLPGREEPMPQRRPVQNQRPQGQRPAGSQPQGQRPAGSQPQGQRPAGSQPQGQRPAGGQPQAAPKADTAGTAFSASDLQKGEDRIRRETARNLEAQQIQKASVSGNSGNAAAKRPKNFMSDEDEFEFEFLNWQGTDDEK